MNKKEVMTKNELQTACRALNILAREFQNESQHDDWATELQNNGIPIYWNGEEFSVVQSEESELHTRIKNNPAPSRTGEL